MEQSKRRRRRRCLTQKKRRRDPTGHPENPITCRRALFPNNYKHDDDDGGIRSNRSQKQELVDGFKKIDQEVPRIDVGDDDLLLDDDDDVQLQEVLFQSAQYFSCTSSAKALDVKKKGIDESSYVKSVFHRDWSGSDSKYEVGESSCTFCVICDDAKPTGEMAWITKCGHSFCDDCIKKYVGEKIQENVLEVKCPGSKCKVVLDYKFCSSLVPENIVFVWENAIHEIIALSKRRVIVCPHIDCPGILFHDTRNFLIRACPTCGRLMCCNCRSPYQHHTGKTCQEFQAWRARLVSLKKRTRSKT